MMYVTEISMHGHRLYSLDYSTADGMEMIATRTNFKQKWVFRAQKDDKLIKPNPFRSSPSKSVITTSSRARRMIKYRLLTELGAKRYNIEQQQFVALL